MIVIPAEAGIQKNRAGVTTCSVNRLAVSEEVANLKKYLKLF